MSREKLPPFGAEYSQPTGQCRHMLREPFRRTLTQRQNRPDRSVRLRSEGLKFEAALVKIRLATLQLLALTAFIRSLAAPEGVKP